MSTIQTVCVYCGSAAGARTEYRAAAQELGRTLAVAGVRLVYGGAHVGLMGAMADAALAAGGQVTGVIPQQLVDREIAHRGLTELHVVANMHERKHKMAEMADAFVALPGGYGTLDELCEVLGWAQLGLHEKPIVLLDIAEYWKHLFAMLDHGVREGFLKQQNREFARRAGSVEEAVTMLRLA